MKKALVNLENASIELYNAKNEIIDLDVVDQRKLNAIIDNLRSLRLSFALTIKTIEKTKCANCERITQGLAKVYKSLDFPQAIFCSKGCKKVWETDGY